LLRESSQHAGQGVDLRTVAGVVDTPSGIPHDKLMMSFAEAVVLQQRKTADLLRPQLIDALGRQGFVDACAIIAVFHGFTRVADATGIDVDDTRAETAKFVHTELGVTDPATR